MLSLFKWVNGPWEKVRGYLANDMQHLESAVNQRHAATFSDANKLLPGAVQGDPTAGPQVVTNQGNNNAPLWGDVGTVFGPFAAGQPRCSAFNSATQSVASSTPALLTLDSSDFDIGGLHSLTVNTSRVTIPAAGDGTYLVIGRSVVQGNAAGQAQLRLLNKGVTLPLTDYIKNAAGTTPSLATLALLVLAARDYLELVGYQDSGGPLTFGGSASPSRLSVVKLW